MTARLPYGTVRRRLRSPRGLVTDTARLYATRTREAADVFEPWEWPWEHPHTRELSYDRATGDCEVLYRHTRMRWDNARRAWEIVPTTPTKGS